MRSIHALLLTLALSPLAAAQSFDCKLAQSPREHAVCASTRLSALDAEIAASYKSLGDQLSPESATLVESDQREWSQWIDLVCQNQKTRPGAPGSTASPSPAEPARHFGNLGVPGQSASSLPAAEDPNNLSHCLQDLYSARANDFKKTVHLGTAIIFSRAHFLYRAGGQSSKLPSAQYPGFGYGSLRWPQIDRKSGDLTSAEAAWNAASKKQAAKFGSGVFDTGQNLTFDTAVNALEDLDADYRIDAANDRLIEVSLIVRSYLWVSGASPLTIRSSFLWWLDHNRQLAPADVFLPISAWQEYIASVAVGRLRANPRLKPLLRDDPVLEDAVTQSAPRTSNWTLTQNGLTITFLQGTVASNPAGMPRVFISWEDLKPFLQPTLNPATLPARLPKQNP